MRKYLLTISLFPLFVFAQETSLLLKEASNLENQFKEQDALNKYKQVLVNEPNNVKALLRATELTCSVGGRLPNKNDKRLYFETSLNYAKHLLAVDSNNADGYYAIALSCGKITEVETENKKIVQYVRDIKANADKALKLNPNHAMANFIVGKWHYEMITLNWAKRLVAKTLYGGLPDPSLDEAIKYLEKSKTIDPYFVLNTLTLGKAYQQNNNPSKAIEIFSRCTKLPTRTFDDPVLKAEAQKLLDNLQ
jgi:tetratricopeptide (TPR) repeat protein